MAAGIDISVTAGQHLPPPDRHIAEHRLGQDELVCAIAPPLRHFPRWNTAGNAVPLRGCTPSPTELLNDKWGLQKIEVYLITTVGLDTKI